MKKNLILLTALMLSLLPNCFGQPTQPGPPAAGNSSNCAITGTGNVPLDQCGVGSTTFVSTFLGGVYNRGNNGNNLGAGAIWRFTNIGTVSGVTINAEVTVNSVSNAILTNMDDNTGTDQAGNPVADFFAPIITPDVSLNASDRRGYVQFTVNFFQGVNNFTTPITMNNLNLVSYDADGSFSGTPSGAWFRETRVAETYVGGNPTILASSPSELIAYNYTHPVATSWTGFAGGVYERTGISRCAEVASSFRYGNGVNGRSSITFRFGYDFKAGTGYNVGNPGRQYGARFGCYNFPNQSTLPVNITSFTASRDHSDVMLKWETSWEQNSMGFAVERNTNGTWQEVAFVNSLAQGGNSSDHLNYQYIDANDFKGISQYRIRQVDFNGTSKYSEIRTVRGEGKDGKIVVYPNPSLDGKVNISFDDASVKRDVSLMDMSGRVVKQWKGVTYNNITIVNLTPGMYMLRVVVLETGEQTVEKISVNKR